MTEQKDEKRTEKILPQPEGQWLDYDDDEISLGDLFSTIWRARGRIVIYTLIAGFAILALISAVYFTQESEYVAKQQFKLQFTGADQNQYPNGMMFSTADILSTEVLNKVYSQNGLERYMTFADFKGGLAIYQENDRLRLLEYDYSQKLSEKNLSMDNRQRLEQEYLEKKKALMTPVYSLVFVQGGSMASMPNDLAAKALQDILAEWALYADRVKGAGMYQLELVSPNVLQKEAIDAEDYLVATDMLRLMIQRVLKDLGALSGLPGAKVAKVAVGGASINDLKYRLQDLEQFKLKLLLGLIRQTSVSKYPEITMAYLKNQLFDLNLRKDQTAANVAIYENSLNQYITKTRGAEFGPVQSELQQGQATQGNLFGNIPAMIPQFGESFLDSLVQMAQQNSDALFRQNLTKQAIDAALEKVDLEYQAKFYEDMSPKILNRANLPDNMQREEDEGFLSAVLERIDKNQQEVFDGLMATIQDMNLIYESLSKSNLNPESTLYSTTSPTLFSVQKPISVKRLVMMAVLGMFLCEGVILMAVLVRGSKKAA